MSPEPDAITVHVRLAGRLGPGRQAVRLAAGGTVADLLAGVAVAVAGEVVGRDRALRDGEALVLVLPVAGG